MHSGPYLTQLLRFFRHALSICLGLCWLVGPAARAQFAPPQIRSTHSQSGQFIVYAAPTSGNSTSGIDPGTNSHLVQLEPTLLAVSVERIKQILSRELGATVPWRGKIYLQLYSPAGTDEPVTIVSEHFRDGWQYRLALPEVMERTSFVRAMVQVLLLEMANRGAGERSAEIPLWLSEGFAQQLLISSELEIILPPPRLSVNGLKLTYTGVSARREDPLEKAHQQLMGRSALTFEQLSWPAETHFAGQSAEIYRSSAQLFLNELLRLNDGPSCMRAMLAELPQYYNWQFAFLHAFAGWFRSPLEVEKWWALRVVHFTGRDLAQTWPLEETWQKLDQIVRTGVEVRSGSNELPIHTEVSLQRIIREWEAPRQTDALQGKLRDLALLSQRAAPSLFELVQGYYQAIDNYLQHRDKPTSILSFLKKPALSRATGQTLERLDQLDDRRLMLKPEPKPVAAAQPPP